MAALASPRLVVSKLPSGQRASPWRMVSRSPSIFVGSTVTIPAKLWPKSRMTPFSRAMTAFTGISVWTRTDRRVSSKASGRGPS